MNHIPTLYEWAGDMQTFETLFNRFYDKVLKDDLDATLEELRWCEKLGGGK